MNQPSPQSVRRILAGLMSHTEDNPATLALKLTNAGFTITRQGVWLWLQAPPKGTLPHGVQILGISRALKLTPQEEHQLFHVAAREGFERKKAAACMTGIARLERQGAA